MLGPDYATADGAFGDEWPELKIIDITIEECSNAFLRCPNDRFFRHIKRRIHNDW